MFRTDKEQNLERWKYANCGVKEVLNPFLEISDLYE